MTRGAPKLKVDRVSKKFRGARDTVDVLSEVSFDVLSEEFVSIIGRSGCGKTTLLRIIAGLERASSGQVLLDCEGSLEVVSRPGPDRGMVFQEHFLFPWRTARQNIEFGLEFIEKDRIRRRQIADEYLQLVKLTEAADRFPSQLSGGMRQRVAIARALATRPAILLLDEPFASLDTQTRTIFQDELMRIWRVTRKTIVLVTHSIDEAVYLSDRIVVLKPDPGEILDVVQLGLPRPRSRSSTAFVTMVEFLNRMLGFSEAETVPLAPAAMR